MARGNHAAGNVVRITQPSRRVGKSVAAHLARHPVYGTGFRPTYRVGEVCYCPGCGGSNWWVGRMSAQCAFCDTALPIAGDRRG